MPQLDNYLVTLGMKGQNLVLSQMDKIRKSGKDLSKKKTVVDLVAKTGKRPSVVTPEKTIEQMKAQNTKAQKAIEKKAGASKTKDEKKDNKSEKDNKKRTDEDKKNNSKFSKSVDKFGNSATNLAHGSAHLDPAAAIGSGLGELAKMTGIGIPFAIAGAALTMASNTMNMARTTTAEQHGLTQRNATADYYGGKIGQTDRASNAEQAALRMTVGSSFGVIQKPLADAINKLSFGKENYNTAALARVASGNWQSTGTDKGWMVQQLADSFQGLPPSIAQKFQASLLNQFGAGEIQKAGPEEVAVQRNNAKFQNLDEAQTKAVYGAVEANMADILQLNTQLKDLQVGMVKAGAAVVGALEFVANTIQKAGAKMGSKPTTGLHK